MLCLQETKLSDAAFPHMAFAAFGYESVHHGSGQWNGVAILSRVGVEDPVMGFADGAEADQDTRLVSARCGGVQVCSVYVPNGRSVGSEHYTYKLNWLARLRKHLAAIAKPTEAVAVCGDFNIAPTDKDVWDPAAFVGATHVTPEERQALFGPRVLGARRRFSPAMAGGRALHLLGLPGGRLPRASRDEDRLHSLEQGRWPEGSRGRWLTATRGKGNFLQTTPRCSLTWSFNRLRTNVPWR